MILGLAFQIADDLLDYDGDAAALGKPTGQDAHRGKGSFVVLMGAGQARATAHRLIEDALAVLAPWPQAGYLGLPGDIRYCTQIDDNLSGFWQRVRCVL